MPSRFLNNIRVNDSYTLPSADGSNNQVITTDGAGNLSFIDVNSVVDTATGEVYYTVKNSTGSQLLKGKAVMAVGTDGNSGHILVDEMVADGSVDSKYFLGILAENINNGNTGKAIHFGQIDQFNTNGQNGETWQDGQILWCDPANPGDFTITEPDGPNLKKAPVFILKASTNGKIQVRVQTNEGVKDLYDTKITSQVDGDVLVWNNTTGIWFNDSTLNVDYTAGKVGIGTDNPQEKLHIYSTASAPVAAEIETTQTTDATLKYTNSVGSYATLLTQTGQFSIYDYNAERHRFYMLSNGDIGIGTTIPDSKLHVYANNDNAPTVLTIENGDPGVVAGQDLSKIEFLTNDESSPGAGVAASIRTVCQNAGNIFDLAFNTQNISTRTETMRLTGAGNLGIGTTNPDSKLEVASTDINTYIHVRNDSTGSTRLKMSNSTDTNSNGFQIINNALNGQVNLLNYKATTLALWTNSIQRMTILSSGNVGIGTTNPDSKLEVEDSGSLGVNKDVLSITNKIPSSATINTTVGMNFNLQQSSNAAIPYGAIRVGEHLGTGSIKGSMRFMVQNYSGGFSLEEKMRIESDGNVGIGTTNAQAKLHVANGTLRTWTPTTGTSAIFESTASNRNFLTITATNESEIWFGDAAVQARGRVRYENNNNTMEFWTNGSPRMHVDSIGNVGIGTTVADGKLHIYGTSDSVSGLVLEATNNGDNRSIDFHNTGGGFRLGLEYDNANINLNIVDSSRNKLVTFREGGNVGIGTTGPAEKLHVNGNVRATQFQLASSTQRIRLSFGTIYIESTNGVRVQNSSGTLKPVTASAFNTSSDYRLKSNIVPLEDAINRLNQLEVHRFNWNDRLDEPKVDGFIAHEVAPIIPEAVLGEKDAVREDGTPDYQGIDQSKIVPLLTAALQEAISKIESLETRIQTLENK